MYRPPAPSSSSPSSSSSSSNPAFPPQMFFDVSSSFNSNNNPNHPNNNNLMMMMMMGQGQGGGFPPPFPPPPQLPSSSSSSASSHFNPSSNFMTSSNAQFPPSMPYPQQQQQGSSFGSHPQNPLLNGSGSSYAPLLADPLLAQPFLFDPLQLPPFHPSFQAPQPQQQPQQGTSNKALPPGMMAVQPNNSALFGSNPENELLQLQQQLSALSAPLPSQQPPPISALMPSNPLADPQFIQFLLAQQQQQPQQQPFPPMLPFQQQQQQQQPQQQPLPNFLNLPGFAPLPQQQMPYGGPSFQQQFLLRQLQQQQQQQQLQFQQMMLQQQQQQQQRAGSSIDPAAMLRTLMASVEQGPSPDPSLIAQFRQLMASSGPTIPSQPSSQPLSGPPSGLPANTFDNMPPAPPQDEGETQGNTQYEENGGHHHDTQGSQDEYEYYEEQEGDGNFSGDYEGNNYINNDHVSDSAPLSEHDAYHRTPASSSKKPASWATIASKPGSTRAPPPTSYHSSSSSGPPQRAMRHAEVEEEDGPRRTYPPGSIRGAGHTFKLFAKTYECIAHRNTRYNPLYFDCSPPHARFFIIKSFSEDDVYKSVKFNLWTSTEGGNQRLDEAFREAQAQRAKIFLFFSVNGSGHFVGVAEMMSEVDFDKYSGFWVQEKWRGEFHVRWVFVKDVPNSMFRHITLPNNEDRVITFSRDTQEVPYEQGCEALKVIHGYVAQGSIFDDFEYYEKRHVELTDSRKRKQVH